MCIFHVACMRKAILILQIFLIDVGLLSSSSIHWRQNKREAQDYSRIINRGKQFSFVLSDCKPTWNESYCIAFTKPALKYCLQKKIYIWKSEPVVSPPPLPLKCKTGSHACSQFLGKGLIWGQMSWGDFPEKIRKRGVSGKINYNQFSKIRDISISLSFPDMVRWWDRGGGGM